MSAKIPWLRVSVEALAIVSSILLAFGIQAWWDERGADDLRTRALEAVLVDMQENTDELERWIDINARIIGNSDLLLDMLETAPEGAAVAVPDTLLAAAVLIPTFDPRLASVEAVTRTGSVILVQDDSLRADLGA